MSGEMQDMIKTAYEVYTSSRWDSIVAAVKMARVQSDKSRASSKDEIQPPVLTI